jgi:predicted DNA-binding transcriptional regulator AlpA
MMRDDKRQKTSPAGDHGEEQSSQRKEANDEAKLLDDDERLITIAEACRILGVKSRATVYRWAEKEYFTIRKRKGSNSSRILKSELMRHLRSLPPISPEPNKKRPRPKRGRQR